MIAVIPPYRQTRAKSQRQRRDGQRWVYRRRSLQDRGVRDIGIVEVMRFQVRIDHLSARTRPHPAGAAMMAGGGALPEPFGEDNRPEHAAAGFPPRGSAPGPPKAARAVASVAPPIPAPMMISGLIPESGLRFSDQRPPPFPYSPRSQRPDGGGHQHPHASARSHLCPKGSWSRRCRHRRARSR